MELRQLQYFDAVARHESFSKAADELFIAQSALSKSISKLEEELNVQLFIRGSKTTRLSPAGTELQSYLRTILPAVNGIAPHLHDYVEHHVEACTICVLASLSYVTEIIEGYSRSFPNLQINTTRKDDPSVYDLKFLIGTPDFNAENTILLKDLEFYLLVSSRSPIARMSNVRLREMAEYNYIANDTTAYFTQAINAAFEKYTPDVEFQTHLRICDNNTLCYLVEQDRGFTIMPDVPNLLTRYQVTLVPIEHHAIRYPLYLTWSKNGYLSKAAKNFISYTCDYFGVTPTGIASER